MRLFIIAICNNTKLEITYLDIIRKVLSKLLDISTVRGNAAGEEGGVV